MHWRIGLGQEEQMRDLPLTRHGLSLLHELFRTPSGAHVDHYKGGALRRASLAVLDEITHP